MGKLTRVQFETRAVFEEKRYVPYFDDNNNNRPQKQLYISQFKGSLVLNPSKFHMQSVLCCKEFIFDKFSIASSSAVIILSVFVSYLQQLTNHFNIYSAKFLKIHLQLEWMDLLTVTVA